MDNKNQTNKALILLKIQTKEGISFNDNVKAITSFNEKGIFDVLPQHENFISVIKDKIIIHTKDGKDKEMKIDNGVLKVYENEAHILLSITETNV
ncbi:MAG: hypothetical protein AAB609_04010 [Patescibacteria group bacterium]